MPPCVATMICERQRASCPACGARRQPGSSGGGVSSCPSSRPCAAISASCLSWPWPLTFLSRFFLPVRIATHMSELRWKPIVKGRLSGARMTGRAANGSGRCAHLRRRRRAAVQLIVRQLGTGMPTSAGAAGGSATGLGAGNRGGLRTARSRAAAGGSLLALAPGHKMPQVAPGLASPTSSWASGPARARRHSAPSVVHRPHEQPRSQPLAAA